MVNKNNRKAPRPLTRGAANADRMSISTQLPYANMGRSGATTSFFRFQQKGDDRVVVHYRQPVVLGAYGNFIPSNPALLPTSRAQKFASLFGRVKVLSFSVDWVPIAPADAGGYVVGGSLAIDAGLDDPSTNLPLTNGGFATSVWRPARGVVDCSTYYDRFYPTSGTVAEACPFHYSINTDLTLASSYGMAIVESTVILSCPTLAGLTFSRAQPQTQDTIANITIDGSKYVTLPSLASNSAGQCLLSDSSIKGSFSADGDSGAPSGDPVEITPGELLNYRPIWDTTNTLWRTVLHHDTWGYLREVIGAPTARVLMKYAAAQLG